MQSRHINSFLESSILVLEQMCRIRPSVGKPSVRSIVMVEGPIWLKISVIGDMVGDIVYCFPRAVALKLVSDMMGGFIITELDEIGQSAIAELGNMISGNACTILSNEGIIIDITPPKTMLINQAQRSGKSLVVPLQLEGIGEVDIYVNVKASIRAC
ncbi:MAG: chemotaxis protein CheX [Paenibacillaceae bacterium]